MLASDVGAAASGEQYPPAPGRDDIPWLEPMPDAWLASGSDPGARYELRESVALAFVAVLQVLTPAQRAVLLLRDVAGLSAEETAEALDQSVSATTSALYRARVAVEHVTAPAVVTDEAVVAKYVRAIAEHDLEAMIALLHADIHTTMPPSPTWIAGRADNVVFYTRMFAGWTTGRTRVVPIGVNGGVGFEFHRDGVLRAIEAVEIRDGCIHRMHHFMQPRVLETFNARA
ncbi:MAG TPA: sigma factor-like helix-turn-helix DNA-binding protein [Kofleriaceae bacterium]|nr:sigma factor-like helix-turn-helix DNA-binding protein [Kofleriaceae bacterium]